MKHTWYKIYVILIMIFLFLSFNGTLAYSSPEKFDEKQNVCYSNYMTDWSVHHIDQNNTYDVDNPVFNNVEPRESVYKMPAGSTDASKGSVWPMLSHDVQHSGRSPYNTAENSGEELWRIMGYESGDVWSSAVIDDHNIIYFGTIGSDSALYALYPNGTMKWRYQSNGLIWSTPAIGNDGTIYLVSWGSKLVALDSEGHEKWIFGGGDPISSSPAIAENGTIYFGTMAGNFYAVNPNGTEQWHLYLGGNLISSPAIGRDNTIYIGTTSNYFYAVNPNGTLQWQFGAGQFKGNPSIAPDDTIYAPCFNGYLYAFYPNGTVKWQASTGGSVAGAGVAIMSDGTVYIGTERLRAYYPNGTLKWITDVQGDIYGTVPAISADGTIYVSAGGSLVTVNPDGTEKWRTQLTIAQIHSSPCIGPDDRVYVGSEDYGISPYGYLHAFGPGQPKNITIEEPHQGHWYLFSKDMGPTRKGNTIVLGSVKIKAKASIEQEIDHVDFSVAHFKEVEPEYQLQYTDTTPPFEWTMNEHYGNDLFTHLPFDQLSIRVTGYYKGGCSWTEEIPKLWYFHLL